MMAADSEVWDIQQMKRLIEAVATHPTLETACASEGLSVDTVNNWMRRGQQPGAPEVLYRFAMAMGQAEANHASTLYQEYLRFIRQGSYGASAARVLLELINKRWKIGTGAELLASAKQGPKRTDDLKAMLTYPSPRLRSLLRDTGWSRPDDWQPPVKLLAPAPDAEE